MAFGCRYCGKVKDVFTKKCNADSKKVDRYLLITLPTETKHKTGNITKHELVAQKLYERIGTLKWGITPYIEKLLEAVSLMTT